MLARLVCCYRFQSSHLHPLKFLEHVLTQLTPIEPEGLLTTLKEIENLVGRTPTYKWGPREIDIDILLFGDVVLNSETLTIPHAGLPDRLFALQPLNEIASHVLHPELGMSVAALLEACRQNKRPTIVDEV